MYESVRITVFGFLWLTDSPSKSANALQVAALHQNFFDRQIVSKFKVIYIGLLSDSKTSLHKIEVNSGIETMTVALLQ